MCAWMIAECTRLVHLGFSAFLPTAVVLYDVLQLLFLFFFTSRRGQGATGVSGVQRVRGAFRHLDSVTDQNNEPAELCSI